MTQQWRLKEVKKDNGEWSAYLELYIKHENRFIGTAIKIDYQQQKQIENLQKKMEVLTLTEYFYG